MYIIQFINGGLFSSDRRRKHAYFMGFYKGRIREYGARSKAMQFNTRAEAETFLREVLKDREDHKVVKA